ncbi:MAG: ROK family protein [Acidimicrobiales bacterium]
MGAPERERCSTTNMIIGVDIGGTKTHAIAFDSAFVSLGELQVPTVVGDAALVSNTVVETIADLCEKVTGRSLSAIGIGIPGLVDQPAGTVRQAVNLGIGDEPLRIEEQVRGMFRVPCLVDNDVNLAALGAFLRLRNSDEIRNLAYLSVGTGIAAGVIVDGRVHRGRRGVAGEIGHLPIVPDGPECECGLTGCLEVLASGSAIARLWPATPDTHPAKALLAAAHDGDQLALETLESIADHLARAVHLLAVTYDPDLVVIGGGVAEVGDPLLDAIKNAVRRLEQRSSFVTSLDVTSRLVLKPGGAIGAYGAAALAESGRFG